MSEPFGFTHDMVEAIRTMLYDSGGSFCPKCVGQSWEGGNGIAGNPDCVVRCGACGWQPRADGLVREHGRQAIDIIESYLSPEPE